MAQLSENSLMTGLRIQQIRLAKVNVWQLAASSWISLVLFLSMSACSSGEQGAQQREQGVINVVTTVAPITSIVENIAGDKVRITGIVPEGMNSHTFEPIPSDTKLLAIADLILLNGLNLEIPTLRLAQANKKPGTPIVLLGNKVITEKDYHFDFSFPLEKGHPNPHLWLNPEYAMRYALIIRDELIRLDPDNQATYNRSSAAYIARLQTLILAIESAVTTIPEEKRLLLTYHDSWPYFARRYGFRIIGAVQPSDLSDPRPREVARLIDQIRSENVPAVFGSKVFPSRVLEQIAKEAGTRYIDKLRDDDLPGSADDPQHSYIGMMLYNVRTIIEALGGSTDALLEIDPAPMLGSYANYISNR